MDISSPVSTPDVSLFQTDFPPLEFSTRRDKVFDQIGNNAFALLRGASPLGELQSFRQSNDFYYLCGVEVPDAYLLLDGNRRKTTLYLPGHNPGQERSEGPILNSDQGGLVQTLTGVDEVRKTDELPHGLTEARTIYTLHGRPSQDETSDPLSVQPTREAYLISNLQALCPTADIEDLSPIIRSLRMIKSTAEINLMRHAGQLTALAVAEAMRCTRPSVMEYQLATVADYIFLINGSRGGGYPPIIAGGKNAWHAHYSRNDSPLKDGDLVLMDYAPDYGYYTSDIGRMFPVNGTYTAWQRELYGFIVKYHKALLRRIRPGAMASEIMDDAAQEMKQIIDQTTFSKAAYENATRGALEFRGHLSHTVGMDVHDRGDYRNGPLIPGTVFSVDPMIWIPEERLYIRVEDTVVITEDGIENLTQLAPLELDDVEQLMKEEGIIQKLPPVIGS